MAGINYNQERGYFVPDTLDTLENEQKNFRNIAGDQSLTVDKGPISPIINAIVEVKDYVARSNAAQANQLDPKLVGGINVDAHLAFFDDERKPAQKTRVICRVSCDSGAYIPAGSRVLTDESIVGAQHELELESDLIFSDDQDKSATFICVEAGPFVIPENGVKTIKTKTIGWHSVTNDVPGVTGRATESDALAIDRIELMRKRYQAGTAEAVESRVSAIDSVVSVGMYNNFGSSPANIGSVSVPAKHIFIAVEGGSHQHIIDAIGRAEVSSTAGNESGTYTCPITSAQYQISYSVTESKNVRVRLYLDPSGGDLSPEVSAKNAFDKLISGALVGYRGFTTGRNINAYEIAEAINLEAPGIRCKRCEISTNEGASFFTEELEVGVFEKAYSHKAWCEVVI